MHGRFSTGGPQVRSSVLLTDQQSSRGLTAAGPGAENGPPSRLIIYGSSAVVGGMGIGKWDL
jgi:hypothetical protein